MWKETETRRLCSRVDRSQIDIFRGSIENLTRECDIDHT